MPAGVVSLPLPGRRFATSPGARPRGGESSAPTPGIDAFITGDENALLAGVIGKLLTALDSPADQAWLALHQPVVIWGPSGSGKSHLARGVAAAWHARRGTAEVAYFTASDFQRQVADAIDAQRLETMRRDLRSCKLLVIEDLDRLSQAEYLQHELTATLEALQSAGGIFLATATKPLVQAANCSRRVLSRLASGLAVEIANLGPAARAELLLRTWQAHGRHYEPAAIERLAKELTGDAAEVFHWAARLGEALPDRQPLTVSFVEQHLARRPKQCSLSLAEIARITANYYGVSLKMLTSSSRRRTVVLARGMVIYLARQRTRLSYEELGRYFGGRDHTTIMHSFQRIDAERTTDPQLAAALHDLELRMPVEELG